MEFGVHTTLELEKLAQFFQATIENVRGSCQVVTKITPLRSSQQLASGNPNSQFELRELKNKTSIQFLENSLGVLLEKKYFSRLTDQRPQCFLTFQKLSDGLKRILDDDFPLTLIIIEESQECDQTLGKFLRFIEQTQSSIQLADLPPKVGDGFIDPTAIIHPTAIIAETAHIGANTEVGAFCVIEEEASLAKNTILAPYCYIGPQVSIGEGCELAPRVTILKECNLGDHIRIHAGAVIGSPGFGLDKQGQLPHLGTVNIESNVRVGALTCIDRATLGQTYVGRGTQLDNLIQIGHNVEIGPQSILCAQSGLAGSAKLEKQVILGGQVGVKQGVSIKAGSKLAAKSGVTKSLRERGEYSGYPAENNKQRLRREAHLRKLALDKLSRVQSLSPDQNPYIHPTANIHKSAQVHPTAVVGAGSYIGENCILKAYSVIGSKVTLGSGCIISSFAVIGAEAQIKHNHTEDEDGTDQKQDFSLDIGSQNRFHEGVTISKPSQNKQSKSKNSGPAHLHIGSHNLFMAYSHLGHDSFVGSHCVIANQVSIAGHVKIHDYAQLGGHCAIHQFVTIGHLSFIAANAMVSGDVPAYCLAAGDRAMLRGLNIIGLRRAGVDAQSRLLLKRAYRYLTLNRRCSLEDLSLELERSPLTKELKILFDSFQQTKRHICKNYRTINSSDDEG